MRILQFGGVRNHIVSMYNIAAKLKGMDMALSRLSCSLRYDLTTKVPSEFSILKISYNTNEEKWSISDLISYWVEEEEMHNGKRTQGLVNVISPTKRKHQGNLLRLRRSFNYLLRPSLVSYKPRGR